jgi:FdhE protein
MAGELLAQIDRLMQKRPIYKEALSAYRELVVLLEEAGPEIEYASGDKKLREIKAKEGFPLFSREELPVDLKATSSLFTRVLDHLSSKKREDREALKRALERARTDGQWIERMLRAFLARDEATIDAMAQEVSLDSTVIKFVTTMALKPSLNTLRGLVSGAIQKGKWEYGYCPLCGSRPDMAYLDEQGKRMLHCELCGFEWNYPRIQCPFCENSDSEELGYFMSEEEKGLRVDYCKKCNAYIKTIDLRVAEAPAPLELENLITLHLDMLAHEQGFATPSG